jgi:hypothetical protein
MDLEGPAPCGKKEELVSWFCCWQYGSTVGKISLAFCSQAWICWCISCSCRNSHDCRSASLGGLEKSAALEERRSARRLISFQSPRSIPNILGLPLSCAQPACASPPSFRIRCHRPAYSAELAGTQNPLPKPCHWLTDWPSELIYMIWKPKLKSDDYIDVLK